MSREFYAIDHASEESVGVGVRSETGSTEDFETEPDARAAFDRKPGTGWTLFHVKDGFATMIARK
jgi:hypothetical protein